MRIWPPLELGPDEVGRSGPLTRRLHASRGHRRPDDNCSQTNSKHLALDISPKGSRSAGPDEEEEEEALGATKWSAKCLAAAPVQLAALRWAPSEAACWGRIQEEQ